MTGKGLLLRMHAAQRSMRACAWIVAASVFTASCQTLDITNFPWQEPKDITPAEKQMREDADKFTETVVGGAVIGAIAGAILLGGLCALAESGGNRRNSQGRKRDSHVAECAMAGAAIGGIMGGADGYATAKQQEASAKNVRAARLMAADIEADNRNMSTLVENSRRVLDESKQRIAETTRKLAEGAITAEQMKAERARVEKNREVMQGAVDGLKKRRENYQQAGAKAGGSSDAEFTRQIQLLNSQLAKLEETIAGMSEVLTVNRV